jgi:hypothetical protein
MSDEARCDSPSNISDASLMFELREISEAKTSGLDRRKSAVEALRTTQR